LAEQENKLYELQALYDCAQLFSEVRY